MLLKPVGVENIALVLVLYEKKIEDSSSYSSLKEQVLPENTYIYDNSLKPHNDNSSTSSINFLKGLNYFHDSRNLGVSFAYNFCVKQILERNKELLVDFPSAKICKVKNIQYVLLADQDTEFPSNYLQNFLEELNLLLEENFLGNVNKIQVFFPKIYSENNLVSPVFFKYCRAFAIKEKNIIDVLQVRQGEKFKFLNLKNIRPINSGLFIDLEAFQVSGGYDERVFLDLSDFAFIEKICKRYKNKAKGLLLNVNLKHNLSEYSKDYNFNDRIKRFKIYLESYLNFPTSKLDKAWLYLWALLKSLKLSLKYKKLDFIKMVLFKFCRK